MLNELLQVLLKHCAQISKLAAEAARFAADEHDKSRTAKEFKEAGRAYMQTVHADRRFDNKQGLLMSSSKYAPTDVIGWA